jgi:hypothetical protein
MPAAPIPESALPKMKTGELGAAPQMAEPISKIKMLERRTSLTEYSVYSLPNNSWNAQHVNKYALPYQPTSGRELKSLVISGIACGRQN